MGCQKWLCLCGPILLAYYSLGGVTRTNISKITSDQLKFSFGVFPWTKHLQLSRVRFYLSRIGLKFFEKALSISIMQSRLLQYAKKVKFCCKPTGSNKKFTWKNVFWISRMICMQFVAVRSGKLSLVWLKAFFYCRHYTTYKILNLLIFHCYLMEGKIWP